MARIALDLRTVAGGGGRTYIENLTPALLRGAPHHEFCFIRLPSDSLQLPEGISTITAPASHPILQLVWVQLRLPSLLLRKRIDVYHSLKHLGPLRLAAPKVFTQRAVGHFYGNYPLPKSEELYWRTLGRAFLRTTDRVIAVSRFVADGIPEDLGIPMNHVAIVPHGLDPLFVGAAERLGQARIRGQHLLGVGNLLPVKNFGTLIQAYAELAPNLRARYPLLLAGGTADPEAGRLRQLAARCGVAEDVRFLGYVSREALVDLYRAAALFIMSSVHEAFPHALLEAMASGTCCICAACGGGEELGGETIVVIPDPRDVATLTRTIESLLADDGRRNALALAARAKGRSYTWEASARQTLGVYDDLLSEQAEKKTMRF